MQWDLMKPFLIGLILTLVGLSLGIVSDRFAHYDAGDGKMVVLFWTIYNIFVLALTIIVCIELPRSERHVADTPERARFTSEAWTGNVWLASLTRDTARVRGHDLPIGTEGLLHIRGVGDVPVLVLTSDRSGVRLELIPSDEQYRALMLRFYTEGDAPGVSVVRASSLIRDLARRLSFNSGPR